MFLCLGEPLWKFSCCWLSSSHLLMFFILFLFFSLLFNIFLYPSVEYRRGFYTPFYTFSPDHCRVIRDTFVCLPIPFLLQTLRPWVSIFLPRGIFLPYATSQHFWHRLFLSKPPWELAVLPWSLQGFILILETQTRPICIFDLQ